MASCPPPADAFSVETRQAAALITATLAWLRLDAHRARLTATDAVRRLPAHASL